jgi:hypothetical protein
MSETENTTRECPLCKEEIKAEAVRCKHCHATIRRTEPGHEGTCPLCKENINPQAIRCPHCKADLLSTMQSCGCHGRPRTRRVPRRISRRTVAYADVAYAEIFPGHCTGCAMYEEFDGVLLGLEGCDPEWCYYSDPNYA